MELDEEEAGSRMHVCRGLSGLHLLPALTRNLGVLLTARALRKLQESGVVNRHVVETLVFTAAVCFVFFFRLFFVCFVVCR